jgi:hypothetical protein
MKDEILGGLSASERFPQALEGGVDFKGRQIQILVRPDGEDMSDCLALARTIVSSLSKFDEIARAQAAQKLLDDYNNNWREYVKATGDGRSIKVSNPEISSEEFAERLTLGSIQVTGESCTLGYDDGGLFAGHSIFVTSFDGAQFKDVHAELFG